MQDNRGSDESDNMIVTREGVKYQIQEQMSKVRHLLVLAVAAIVMTGINSCASSEQIVSPARYEFNEETRGPLSVLFQEQSIPKTAIQVKPYESLDDDYLRKVGITEIAMEATGCRGSCPEYYVVYNADGTAVYEGYKNVKLLGRHCGRIYQGTFALLVKAVQDIGYFQLLEHYSQPTTDAPSTYSSVVKNGQRKMVKAYASAGPGRLIALEGLIDSVESQVQWNRCAE
ncbi:MAG: DUF6438 domain-containing protein [Dehalococcoidia bacterium]